MKAVVKNSSKPFDISIKEVNEDKVNSGDVRIKVAAVGICGSDIHMYAGHSGYDWIRYPLVFGHEVSGTVEEVGENANSELIGKRVIVNPYLPCGECEFCLRGEENRCDGGQFFEQKLPPKSLQYGFRKNGGMSEFLVVPEKNVIPIDDSVSNEVGAILEAIAVGETAVEKIDDIDSKAIVVFGPGPIGLGIVSILVGLSAKKIVVAGVPGDEQRLDKAKELGAHEVIVLGEDGVKGLLNLTPNGYDAMIDSSGHDSVPKIGIKVLKKGGQMVLVGISTNKVALPMDQIVRGEILISGSYGITGDSLKKTVKYASNPAFPFEKLISKKVHFENVKEGFQNSINRAPGKTVVSFTELTW